MTHIINRLAAFFTVLVGSMAMMTSSAHAVPFLQRLSDDLSNLLGGNSQQDSIAGIIANFLGQGDVVADGLFFVLFLAGLFTSGYGIHGIRKHIEDQNNNPLKNQIAKLVTGALLMSAQPTMAALQTLTDSGGVLDTSEISLALDIDQAARDNQTTPGQGATGASVTQPASSVVVQDTGTPDTSGNTSNTGSNNNAVAVSNADLAQAASDNQSNPGAVPDVSGDDESIQACVPGGGTLGGMITNTACQMGIFFPATFYVGFLVGMFFVGRGLYLFKVHFDNPNEAPISKPIKHLVAASLLLSMSSVAASIQKVIQKDTAAHSYVQSDGADVFLEADTAGGTGLDSLMINFVKDIVNPSNTLLMVFCYIVGVVLLLFGLQRLIKTEQDGPKSPLGTGTIMTFIVAGIFLSMQEIMGAMTSTMFGTSTTNNYAILAFVEEADPIFTQANSVLGAMIAFMIVIGWISFIRGFFILKDVADGSQQASLMASITHIVAGVLAVNMGPMLDAVQNTIGLPGIGLTLGQ